MSELWAHAVEYWTAGGLLLIPLAVVCSGIWGFFLRSRARMLSLARECRDLETHVGQQGLDGLGTGPISLLLARISRDVRSGKGPRSAFVLRGDEALELMRRDIVILGALTAVAPLLGLLGTVQGMIGTFSAVAQISGTTGVEVADGISQALITTQFGLVVAVPGVFGVSRLRGLSKEVEARLGTLRAAALTFLESSRTDPAS